MSNNGYGKIERNEGRISVERLQQIADTFEMKVKDILDFDEHAVNHFTPNQPNHVNDQMVSKDVITLNERKLYEETIASLRELLKIKNEIIESFRKKK